MKGLNGSVEGEPVPKERRLNLEKDRVRKRRKEER